MNHGALAYVPFSVDDNENYNSALITHREELFYQLGLRQFGDYSRLKLEPPPPLRAMVKLAVDAEEGTKNSRLSKDQIVDVSSFLQAQNTHSNYLSREL